MNACTKLTLACFGMVLTIAASNASATNYTIDWLNMAPTPFGSSVPNNSVFNLPGVGNVTVTYSIPTKFNHARVQNVVLQNGTVTSGPDNYAWTAQELFGATSLQPNPPFVTTQWQITYTFPGTVAAGTLCTGVMGLGQTTSSGGGASTATVNQNGAFLGDWPTTGLLYGLTQFTGGPGTFSMQNSATGSGGFDPWWNSALGVVQILDPVSSLTVVLDQLPGDGVGVNIGVITPVPEPASLGLFAAAALTLLRRRARV